MKPLIFNPLIALIFSSNLTTFASEMEKRATPTTTPNPSTATISSPTPEKLPLCFNLEQKNTKILSPAPSTFAEPGSEKQEFGNNLDEHDWGRVNGIVKKPIKAVYSKLLEPLFTRNAETTRMETSELKISPGVLNRFHHSIHVKPVFFITVEWEEDWNYTLLDGTAENPKAILISYQKTGGTSRIRHFCGNILIKQIDPGTTGVFIVENIDADHRSPEQVYNGILGTLRKLRE